MRKNNKKTWNVLKQAVYRDYEKCQEILLSHLITPVNGCINHCIDKNNVIFRLPNFVVNDAYVEKELSDVVKDKNEKLNVYLYDLYDNRKVKVNLSFVNTGCELKSLFKSNCLNGHENSYKIRLLFGGAEIKDEHTLSQHKIEEGYTIQVMKTKIID